MIIFQEDEMKNALVIYNSKNGTTKNYAEEISRYFNNHDVSASVTSIEEFDEKMLQNIDYLLLGCWTSGLFFFLQGPDKEWNNFASRLPSFNNVKVGFFTTYKVLTGSMFKNMAKRLKGKMEKHMVELKSKDGHFTLDNSIALAEFIK
jgi:flavodoxin